MSFLSSSDSPDEGASTSVLQDDDGRATNGDSEIIISNSLSGQKITSSMARSNRFESVVCKY